MYRLYSIAILAISTQALAAPMASPLPSPEPTPAPSAAATLESGKRLVDQVSAEEKAKAEALWSEAMEKFSARNFKESVHLLGEYVDRYPGTPEAIDARYHLGQSHLFAKNPKAAIAPLQAVIEIRGKSMLANEARTYLGQAYLDDGRFTEAYLVSEELLTQESIGAHLRAKALLLRAHAQAGLKQNTEAEKTLVAFQAVAETDPELESETAHSFLVSLLLKANHCDALPSAKSLPEDQVMDQVSRKGVCILEMGTLLARASKKLSSEELLPAGDALISSLQSYQAACANPPLTAKKGKRAKAELAKKLAEGCRSAERLLVEAFREREPLKSLIPKIQPKTASVPKGSST